MSIKITGLGAATPQKVVDNEILSSMVDTSDAWITTRTGISRRHVLTNESLVDLCERAASEALTASKTKASDIDLIICATAQGDYVAPSLGCMVQSRLAAACTAFDINAACSGFIYALQVAKNFILASGHKKVLIIAADAMSRLVDWTNRDSCVLFGDAATACIVEPGDALEYINLTTRGDDKILNVKPTSGNSPFRKKDENDDYNFIRINGQEVYKFAQGAVEFEIKKALETLDIAAEKIDSFILHQANKRIIDAARTNLALPAEKFPMNIQNYGNTSAASVPLLLHELLRDGKIKSGDKLMLVAFGAGMTSAAAVINWRD
jgi:3-oxoacyl-[acyl-carrier-protein] synthase-3